MLNPPSIVRRRDTYCGLLNAPGFWVCGRSALSLCKKFDAGSGRTGNPPKVCMCRFAGPLATELWQFLQYFDVKLGFLPFPKEVYDIFLCAWELLRLWNLQLIHRVLSCLLGSKQPKQCATKRKPFVHLTFFANFRFLYMCSRTNSSTLFTIVWPSQLT